MLVPGAGTPNAGAGPSPFPTPINKSIRVPLALLPSSKRMASLYVTGLRYRNFVTWLLTW